MGGGGGGGGGAHQIEKKRFGIIFCGPHQIFFGRIEKCFMGK